MEKQITCINCPQGCRMTVTIENGQAVRVEGNTCRRGEVYARQESVAPKRMVTAVIPVSGRSMPVSVKTRVPVPKEMIFPCMKRLSEISVSAPVHMGDIVCADICGTGVDVIATKTVL